MRKLILLLTLLMTPAALFSAAGISPDSLDAALPEKKAGWTLTDTIFPLSSHDLSFQMRGSLRAEMPGGEEASARFRMDNFRWNVEGSFGRNREFYYHFRQSFNANFRSNTFDNLLESIDYAYMTWRPRQHFSRAGLCGAVQRLRRQSALLSDGGDGYLAHHSDAGTGAADVQHPGVLGR